MRKYLIAVGVAASLTAGEWPQFRGPERRGVSEGAALPRANVVFGRWQPGDFQA